MAQKRHTAEQIISNSRQVKGEALTSVLQLLYTEPKKKTMSVEKMARQLVDILLLKCMQAYPVFFKSLGLPQSRGELRRTTSYKLAIEVFSRWETEEDLTEDLTAQAQSLLPGQNHELLRFCAHAILYAFNVRIIPKYRQLFISMEMPASSCR